VQNIRQKPILTKAFAKIFFRGVVDSQKKIALGLSHEGFSF
jgi:hypothetical protein